VFVNGVRAKRSVLGDGDVVRVGSTFFVYRVDDPNVADFPVPSLIGDSLAMRRLRVAIGRVGARSEHVLVQGETGTGKELVARAIHDASGRAGPFLAVNCSAIAEQLVEATLFGHVAGAYTGAAKSQEGLLRAAQSGTLLLDEIGDLDAKLQPKLLRALEQREVIPVGATTPVSFNARVVAATHVDLRRAVDARAFRADLYARLAQLSITVPPLRDRREDVLSILSGRIGARPIEAELAARLLTHHWPLNVREVNAIATRLTTWADAERLRLADVEDWFHEEPTGPARPAPSDPGGASAPPGVDQAAPPSAESLRALLQKHNGNIAAVAREVGRSRTQVYRWLRQLGVDVE
jgi:DNA-binding NtrC family response regulator